MKEMRKMNRKPDVNVPDVIRGNEPRGREWGEEKGKKMMRGNDDEGEPQRGEAETENERRMGGPGRALRSGGHETEINETDEKMKIRENIQGRGEIKLSRNIQGIHPGKPISNKMWKPVDHGPGSLFNGGPMNRKGPGEGGEGEGPHEAEQRGGGGGDREATAKGEGGRRPKRVA
ncbi:hypothetical protein H6P81_012691 [Aristolochia fimbriata]|uniref:Uncharacterized protein n=1 Tax=Aristolochia fimbriata TaxID=158543 RepID=A0AAV7ECU5_ARIFI|nr:hypothetical protein H6P81_012691 [Aristolochia fimbriata]